MTVKKRVVIRNKMGYPVRVITGIDDNDKRTYAKVLGKSTLGPIYVTGQVFTIIREDPSFEVTVR